MTVTGSFVSGQAYGFRMRANNANGNGNFSSYSSTVTPNALVTVPGTPTIGTPTVVSSTQVNVAFTPPASNGGSAITGYVVQSTPAVSLSYSSTDTTSPVLVTGTFTENVTYAFRVAAVNAVGTGTFSSYSVYITPNLNTVPGVPTINDITINSSSSVSIAFTAPTSNGGKAITGYAVQVSPTISLSYSGTTTTSPLSVAASYASGVGYSFRIAAKNVNGTGAYTDYFGPIFPNGGPV